MCETHRHSAAGRSGTATVERAMPKTPSSRHKVLSQAETDAFFDTRLPPPPKEVKSTHSSPVTSERPQDRPEAGKPDEKHVRPTDSQRAPVRSSVEVSRPAHVNPRVTNDEERRTRVAEILSGAVEKEADFLARDMHRQLRHLQREVVGQLYFVLLNRTPSDSEFAKGNAPLLRNVQNALGRLYASDPQSIPQVPKFLELKTNH